jgi:hypothetical protein
MRTSIQLALVTLAVTAAVSRDAHAGRYVDQIPFDIATKAVRTITEPAAKGGDPKAQPKLTFQTFGPAQLSRRMIDAIGKQQNGTVYAYLDGIELAADQAVSITVYIAPAGASASPRFASEHSLYEVGTLANQPGSHTTPHWRMFNLNNLALDGSVPTKGAGASPPITLALARLKAHIDQMKRAHRAPGFELVLYARTGNVKFKRLVLSTVPPGPDDSPDHDLAAKLLPPS